VWQIVSETGTGFVQWLGERADRTAAATGPFWFTLSLGFSGVTH